MLPTTPNYNNFMGHRGEYAQAIITSEAGNILYAAGSTVIVSDDAGRTFVDISLGSDETFSFLPFESGQFVP